MASNNSMSLLGAMDRLWFNQIILLSQPISLINPQIIEPPPRDQPLLNSSKFSSLSLSNSSLVHEKDEERDEEHTSESSPKTPQIQDVDEELRKGKKEIPMRRSSSLITSRIRSHSSSPLTTKHLENLKRSSSISAATKLEKSTSFRSTGELELKEVKGFMDLGFIFKKENLSPRMMSLIPGLQRLALHKDKENGSEQAKDDDEEEEEEERGVIRPYLSEAWLINRPSSPLLSLKVPRFSAVADMKKHLKFWARSVASEIQQIS